VERAASARSGRDRHPRGPPGRTARRQAHGQRSAAERDAPEPHADGVARSSAGASTWRSR